MWLYDKSSLTIFSDLNAKDAIINEVCLVIKLFTVSINKGPDSPMLYLIN